MKQGFKNWTGKVLLMAVLFAVALGGILAAEAQPAAIKVYLAGDSTVKSYGSNRGEGGWGEFLQYYFKENVTIIKKSEGGRSSRSFINESRLKNILDLIQHSSLSIIFGFLWGYIHCIDFAQNSFLRLEPDFHLSCLKP